MLRIILTIVMVGLLITGGIFLFVFISPNSSGMVQSAQDTPTGSIDPDPEPPIIERFDKENIIRVADVGFTPQEFTVRAFEEITWENLTDSTIYIEHYPEDGKRKLLTFSLGETRAGESDSTSFFHKGRYRYWDKYHPERIGFITIE